MNGSKIKVVIFARGKSRKDNDVFMYEGSILETVDDYTYLGVIFNYNGSFCKARKKRYDQASRAMYGLLKHCFDRMVLPILLYGCELWGFEDISILERIHLKFCKYLLNVSKFTPSCMIYNELGRFPIIVSVIERVLNYWAKLESPMSENKWSGLLYRIVRDQHDHGYLKSKWCTFVQSNLNNCGLGFLWIEKKPISLPWFKCKIKQSLSDQYRQNVINDINEHPKCIIYRAFCDTNRFEIQDYLLKLPDFLVKTLISFRLGNNKLPGVLGRIRNNDPEDRTCQLCEKNEIGDEFHYLLDCPHFHEQRLRFLGHYYSHHPNIIKFNKIMCQTSMGKIKKLASFCYTIQRSF